MTTKYEITTIEDIIKNIPLERIPVFIKELEVMILQAKMSFDVVKTAGYSAKLHLPRPLIWDDDGKGEIIVRHHINNEHIFTTKETVST